MTRYGLGLLVVVIWSTCFVVIRATAGETPGLLYAALRALLAAVPLLLLAAGRRILFPPRREWPWLVVLGLTGTALAFSGMFLSVAASGAVLPGVLANSQVLLVAPLAARWFGEPLGARRGAGLLVGIAGLGLAVGAGGPNAGELGGALLALLASVGLAGSTLVIRRLAGRVDVLTATAWQYLLGGLPLLAAALALEAPSRIQWTFAFTGGLLFLALVGSAGASLLWFRLVQRCELIPLTALTLLTPIFSLVLGLILFREEVTPLRWLGIAAVLAGVLQVGWKGPGARAELPGSGTDVTSPAPGVSC